MKACLNNDRARHGGVLFKLLLVLVMGFALVAILWVTLLPGLVVSKIQEKTGFAVKVDSFSVNPFTAKVMMKGLVLKNPNGWPVEDFLEMREFRAEANLLSLLSDRFVADEVMVDVPQVTLVKNQQGLFNAAAFQKGLTGTGGAAVQSDQGGTHQGFLIKHLVLKFGKLVYADHSGRKPVVKEYILNLNRDMRDVDSVAKILSPITGSALGLVSEAMGSMFKGRPDLFKDTAEAIQDAGRKTGEKLKDLLDSLDKKRP